MGKPGVLQSVGLQRIGHDLGTEQQLYIGILGFLHDLVYFILCSETVLLRRDPEALPDCSNNGSLNCFFFCPCDSFQWLLQQIITTWVASNNRNLFSHSSTSNSTSVSGAEIKESWGCPPYRGSRGESLPPSTSSGCQHSFACGPSLPSLPPSSHGSLLFCVISLCLPLRRTLLMAVRVAVPYLFGTRDQFHGRQLFHGLRDRTEDGFMMIQVHYIYRAIYSYY